MAPEEYQLKMTSFEETMSILLYWLNSDRQNFDTQLHEIQKRRYGFRFQGFALSIFEYPPILLKKKKRTSRKLTL